MHRTTTLSLFAALTLAGAVVARAQSPGSLASPDDLKHDLVQLQGVWTRPSVESGKPAVITKTIEGNRETYTVCIAGAVTFEQQVTFKLEAAGPVRLFTFADVVVTAGPNKGKKPPVERGAYIYRLVGGRWFQANGLLDDDREVFKSKEPRLVVFDRLKRQ